MHSILFSSVASGRALVPKAPRAVAAEEHRQAEVVREDRLEAAAVQDRTEVEEAQRPREAVEAEQLCRSCRNLSQENMRDRVRLRCRRGVTEVGRGGEEAWDVGLGASTCADISY